jgi:hypothetical protein
MYIITNKETGFKHYFNTKEAATFIYMNGASKYNIKQKLELKDYIEDKFFMVLTILLMIAFSLVFIEYATLELIN